MPQTPASEAKIKPSEVESANERFDREFAKDFPLLAGLLKARIAADEAKKNGDT